MVNRQKNLRLPDDVIQLMEEIKTEFRKQGWNITDSDLVAAAIRNWRKTGQIVVNIAPEASKAKPKPKKKEKPHEPKY